MSVQIMLKGKHRYHCLCYLCGNFSIGIPIGFGVGKDRPPRDQNCPIANMVYALCALQDLVLPVWECPKFVEKK